MDIAAPSADNHDVLYVMGFAVAIVIIVYVGTFLHGQSTARGPRKNTNHLRKIRTRVRGVKHQDRASRRPNP